MLKGIVLAGAAPMINRGRFRLFAHSATEYSRHAIDLVGRATVIDMLNVLTLDFNKQTRWFKNPETFTDSDLKPYLDSGINVMHPAVGLGGPNAYESALQFFASWNGFIASKGDHFARVNSAADLKRVHKPGKTGVILGLQNSEHFRRPDDVDLFHGLGQRVSQLTYNARNLIGNGSTERRDEGISDFGVSIIERMNKLGMAVDVSHCGDRTTLDAIEISKRPVAITHSNCRALNNHPRLKTDEAIEKCAARGGVMGITGVRNFVRDREPTGIEHIVDHVDHVVKVAGIEHVGIGSDSDLNGYDDMPADQRKMLMESYKSSYAFRDKLDTDGFDHPKKVFDLTEALIRRGYGDSNIESVLGGNFRRLLGTVWVPAPAKTAEGNAA
jgi:membrane dipeptidase